MDVNTRALNVIQDEITSCRLCPRLVEWRELIAREKVRRFKDQEYWGKGVPSFGDPQARLLILGLAPAAHGANRTGRMFTGDSSGAWLSRAMHRAGFATVPHSIRRDDGFEPIDAYITAALRCAPPGNKPTAVQLEHCAPYLRSEIDLLRRLRVVIGLGKIGFDNVVRALEASGYSHPVKRPTFAHGATSTMSAPDRPALALIASYHPSRQNTNTGVLTRPMLDAIFRQARVILD